MSYAITQKSQWLNINYVIFCLPILPVYLFYPGISCIYLCITGCIFIYKFTSYLDKLGSQILLIELIEILAILQWLFAPALYYFIYDHNLITWIWYYLKMQVPINEYFILALPSTIALLLGLRVYKSNNEYDKQISNLKLDQLLNYEIGIYFILTSFVSDILSNFLNGLNLGFVITLTNELLYVGILFILFSNSKYKIHILLLSFLYLVYKAVYSGMLGAAVWWPALIIPFLLLEFRIKPKVIFSYLTMFCIIIFFSLFQSIKLSYRKVTWAETKSIEINNTEFFIALMTDKWQNSKNQIFDMELYYPLVGRLNQGYHVSKAQKYTPENEPYCYGETIFEAILSSLIPRIFWPDKPNAGGKENYLRFTGIKLEKSSMNIGQLGDAYVNFSTIGAPFVLFFYGLFISYIYFKVTQLSQIYPQFILFIPLVFIHIISVESDFVTTLNAATKSTFFVLFLLYILKNRLIKLQ